MDANLVLFLLILSNAGIMAVAALRLPRGRGRDWLTINLGTAAAMVGVWYWRPTIAGYAGLALWAVAVLVPVLVARVARYCGERQYYPAARRLTRLASWFHPTREWRRQVSLLHALELAHTGQVAAAQAVLAELRDDGTLYGHDAIILGFRLAEDWPGLCAWIEPQEAEPLLQGDPNLLVSYLRALGETGRVEDMVQTFRYYEAGVRRFPPLAGLARLFLLAFGGRRAGVQRALALSLAHYPPEVRLFWTATAELAAGGPSPALEQLAQSPAATVGLMPIAIARRRSQDLASPAAALSPAAREVLDELEQDQEQTARYGDTVLVGLRRAYVTWGLIALNVLVFGFEAWQGSSTDIGTLADLGALVLTSGDSGEAGPVSWVAKAAGARTHIYRGEWWRLATACLLHYGALHLAMNMLALLLLGPFVEHALGRWRYGLLYVLTGIGAMAIVSLAARPPGAVVVGASGCVMGLGGATVAILWRAWRRERARVAWRRLLVVAALLAAQVPFDFVVPGVSSAAHLGGAAIGLLLAALMCHQGVAAPGPPPGPTR